ncbi:major royal jelly [Lecanosticta acicola]|uniref:Major royal jelly n=1 Tax=Lecanosticta acicola TaxID=111012 RepID=A0AAI9EEC5_9PEZI|nr:major royal jelly [Lecanosticta acicola]
MLTSNMLWNSLLAIASVAVAIQDSRIKTALTLQTPVNGISTTPSGRLFVLFARVDGSKGIQVAEHLSDGTYAPYPNLEWNSYAEGKDPSTHLIRTNSQRIGPDGLLWLVDVGSPNFGAPVILPDGPKLVTVNLTTNDVQRVFPLGSVTLENSQIDDIRFNPSSGLAYITDAGVPAIIILELSTGRAIRVLENDSSTRGAPFPASAEGQLLHNSADPSFPVQYVYADQHEVSPDLKYYYFQPANGGLSRIPTADLDKVYFNESHASALPQSVSPFALTPSTGGTAIDANGAIYCSDTDRQAIIRIHPNGTWHEFLRDERLLWVDAMWVSSDQKLWMPAAQLNRGTPFQENMTSKIQKPLYVYTIDIGVGPPRVDHA